MIAREITHCVSLSVEDLLCALACTLSAAQCVVSRASVLWSFALLRGL